MGEEAYICGAAAPSSPAAPNTGKFGLTRAAVFVMQGGLRLRVWRRRLREGKTLEIPRSGRSRYVARMQWVGGVRREGQERGVHDISKNMAYMGKFLKASFEQGFTENWQEPDG